MDSGDYIYIILAIVFSIVSAVGKKRKNKNKDIKPSKARGLFEELFDVKSEVVDPVSHPVYYDEEQEYDSSYDAEIDDEEQSFDTVAPISDMQAKLNSLYSQDTIDEVAEKPAELMKKYHATKPHPVINDLRKYSELQKVVIYSEVLKTKF